MIFIIHLFSYLNYFCNRLLNCNLLKSELLPEIYDSYTDYTNVHTGKDDNQSLVDTLCSVTIDYAIKLHVTWRQLVEELITQVRPDGFFNQ